MSIFEVQSQRDAKTAKAKDEAADLKSSGHEKQSRTPLIVGASIGALVLYLKSAYGAHAETPPAPAEDQPEHEEGRNAAADDSMPSGQSGHGRALSAPSALQPVLDENTLETVRQALADDGLSLDLRSGFQLIGMDGLRRHLPSALLSRLQGTEQDGGGSALSTARRLAPSASVPRTPVPNRSPAADGPVFLQNGFATMAVLFTLNDLLRGATDPDGDQLYVTNLHASSGQFIQVDDGYMYIGDVTGPVSVTYDITDGLHVIPQQAFLDVQEHAQLQGTANADTIVGSDSADLIEVGAGADTVTAGGGMDTIYGDDGDDVIHGGAGDDLIVGGAGNDKLFGDDGNDLIFGGLGNDEIHGGKGNDIAYGNDGNDTLSGDEGNDALYGNAGNDVLSDGTGQDYVSGGAGDDKVLAAADGEKDVFDGGAGTDTLSFAASTSSVTIDAVQGTATGADTGPDTFQGFERFEGGAGNDTFIVGKDATQLAGGEGHDTFDILTDGITASAPVRHVIEDFQVGDRVEMSMYDIFEAGDSSPDFLGQMNGDALAPDDAVPVKFRTDDATLKTYIEADFDHDNSYEVTVELDGHHNLHLFHLSA